MPRSRVDHCYAVVCSELYHNLNAMLSFCFICGHNGVIWDVAGSIIQVWPCRVLIKFLNLFQS